MSLGLMGVRVVLLKYTEELLGELLLVHRKDFVGLTVIFVSL